MCILLELGVFGDADIFDALGSISDFADGFNDELSCYDNPYHRGNDTERVLPCFPTNLGIVNGVMQILA